MIFRAHACGSARCSRTGPVAIGDEAAGALPVAAGLLAGGKSDGGDCCRG